MNGRERITKTLDFQTPDRVGMMDQFWPETLNRWWDNEGLPRNISLVDFFDFDFELCQIDLSPRLARVVIEEKEETTIIKNEYGMTQEQWKGKSGPPKPLDVLVKSNDDWLEYKKNLKQDNGRFWGQDRLANFWKSARDRGKFISFSCLDPYENTWRMTDVVPLLEFMLDEPELVYDMFMTSADLTIETAKILNSIDYKADGIWLWGDIAYKNGPLFSPKCYRELLMPAHKKICDFAHSIGWKVIYHTDGYILPLMNDLIEAGIDALQPIEAKCNLDVRELKQSVGKRLTLFGNIDIRVLKGSKEEIEEEVKSKLPVAKEGSGYIYHSDHSVPPSVSFENYKFTLEMIRKYGTY